MTESTVTNGSSDDDQPGGVTRSTPSATGSPGHSVPVSKSLVAVTVVVTIVFVVLRFLPRTALWLDEALSVNIAGLPLGDMPEALRHDGHPPLYYFLLHLWMGIFGDSDWSVRAMSGVISTITIPLAYVAGRTLARHPGSGSDDPRRVALLTMTSMAMMPFAVRYGAEARMYTLVIALVTLGYPIVTGMLTLPGTPGPGADRHRVSRVIATTLIAAALLWTHYWSIWLLAAVGIAAVSTMWARRGMVDRRRAWAGPIDVVVSLVIGGLSFVPWLPTMLFQSAHTGTPWGERFGPFSAAVTTVTDFAGARFGAAQFLSYILVTFIVGAALVSVRRVVSGPASLRTSGDGRSTPDARRADARDDAGNQPQRQAGEELIVGSRIVPRIRPELFVMTVTFGLGWLAAVVSHNTYSSRYASVVFPLFVLSFAAGLSLIRGNRSTLLVLGVTALLCLYGALGSARADRTQVGRLVDAIEEDIADRAATRDAVVVVCPDQLAVATQRVVDQRPELREIVGDVVAFPEAGNPRFVDWVDYAERNAAASPGEFVDRVDATTGSATTIYLIDSPHYRTLEGKCEGVVAGFGVARSAEVLQPLDTSGLDEAAELRVFRPAS